MQADYSSQDRNDNQDGSRSSHRDKADPMAVYWEKLRMDGQFGRWQKPATD
jgi:hypothetical protein